MSEIEAIGRPPSSTTRHAYRLQCEILRRLCATRLDAARPWADWWLRPGSVFLVGNPKQVIYRFRGSDAASYLEARERLTTTDVGVR